MNEINTHPPAAYQITIDTEGNKIVELRTTIVTLKSGGWMHIYYKPNSDVDIADKILQHEVFLKIAGNNKYPVIVTAGDKVSFNKEAIEYGKNIEPEQPFIAVAVVTKKLAYRLVADFYYWFHKPITPYKVLAKEEEALKWFKEKGYLK